MASSSAGLGAVLGAPAAPPGPSRRARRHRVRPGARGRRANSSAENQPPPSSVLLPQPDMPPHAHAHHEADAPSSARSLHARTRWRDPSPRALQRVSEVYISPRIGPATPRAETHLATSWLLHICCHWFRVPLPPPIHGHVLLLLKCRPRLRRPLDTTPVLTLVCSGRRGRDAGSCREECRNCARQKP